MCQSPTEPVGPLPLSVCSCVLSRGLLSSTGALVSFRIGLGPCVRKGPGKEIRARDGTCTGQPTASPSGGIAKQSAGSSAEGQTLVSCLSSVSISCCDYTFNTLHGLGGQLWLLRNCALQRCVACTPRESSKSTLLRLTASPTRGMASFSNDSLPCSIL